MKLQAVRCHVCRLTGATDAIRDTVIQSLWSGYGEIVRYRLQGAAVHSVIVKHVRFPDSVEHPRGWHNDHAHQRKVRSYGVEMHWYTHQASLCNASCRVPLCFGAQDQGGEPLIVLEDLDTAGFARRVRQPELSQIRLCLGWLAHFHARFMHSPPSGLWPVGTYWHLATRPDELKAMQDRELRRAAAQIDARLSACRFLTLVHGDAKLANFCFSDDLQRVAAVDFQYVGGGCGMKDVAYFLGSCLDEKGLMNHEAALLDHYFAALASALSAEGRGVDSSAVEAEWREMYALAATDFYRFLLGWMPGHWKVNDYLHRISRQVLAGLNHGD